MTAATAVRVGLDALGANAYEWIEGWGQVPASELASRGWAHPGMAVLRSGDVVTTHPGDTTLLVFAPDGTLRRQWRTELTEAHGITAVQDEDGEDGGECLWVADNGAKRVPGTAYDYRQGTHGPGAVKLRVADGGVETLEAVLRLGAPELPHYKEGKFSPTSVAVHEQRHGGAGDVWVADGYGQSQVHRFDATGAYLGSITGGEGSAGAFKTPHGVLVDTRKREPELYVADRGNRRIQVYDLEGRFKRAFGQEFLSSPSAFALDGERLVVAELRARLAVLDADDRLVCYLGENEAVCDEPGWPNARDEAGEPVRTHRLQPGRFNSPHGVAVDARGNVYVAEWLIGGRYTKLARR